MLYSLQLTHTILPVPCVTFCLLLLRCKTYKLPLNPHGAAVSHVFSSCRINGGPVVTKFFFEVVFSL